MIQLTLVDGSVVGTGLLVPDEKTSLFARLEDRIDLLTRSQIKKLAQSGELDGRKRFDKSWVKNQRHHGSCQGFSSASALSKARVARGLKRVDLSGAYAYSLVNGGRDQGSHLEAGMRASDQQGYATEDTVPWDKIYPHLYDRDKAQAEAEQYQGEEVYAVETADGYWTALALGFIVVTAVDVGTRFMRTDGELAIAGVDPGPGNHAVHADGLVWSGELVATGQNSWGTSYGREGRMGLREAHYTGPSRYHMTYAFRSTTDSKDSAEEQPPVVEG